MQPGTTFTGTDGLEHGPTAVNYLCACGWEPPATAATRKSQRSATQRHRAKVGTRAKPKARPTRRTEGTEPDPALAAIFAERRTNPMAEWREDATAARNGPKRTPTTIDKPARTPWGAQNKQNASLRTGTLEELDAAKAERENDPAYQKRRAERLARNATRM